MIIIKLFKEKFKLKAYWIDFFILSVLSFAFFGYSMFYRDFAELHPQLSFLNFPIFIGEIILFACIVLTICKYGVAEKKFKSTHIILFIVYIGFALSKVSYGYYKFGPFALRHTAMFYYPLFALISYEAYNNKFININLLLPLLFIAAFGRQQSYYNFTYLILILLYIIKSPYRVLKFAGLMLILLRFRWELFILCCRTQLIGHLAGFLILFILLLKITRIKVLYKTGLVVIILFILSIGFINYKDTAEIKSLITPRSFFAAMAQWDALIDSRRDYYVEHDIKVRLYNPGQKEEAREAGHELKRAWLKADEVAPDSNSIKKRVAFEKSPHQSYNTAIFRLFIWRDMINDLIREKAFLGFNFGKPLRSKTIELSDMAKSIWSRDGWISSHNSYLEIIYRSGLIGISLILAVFTIVIRMAKTFVKFRSLGGVFLISIIVYWLTTTFFYVTLEMPYSAIFFWCIFGWSLAYSHKLESGEHKVRNKTLS